MVDEQQLIPYLDGMVAEISELMERL